MSVVNKYVSLNFSLYSQYGSGGSWSLVRAGHSLAGYNPSATILGAGVRDYGGGEYYLDRLGLEVDLTDLAGATITGLVLHFWANKNNSNLTLYATPWSGTPSGNDSTTWGLFGFTDYGHVAISAGSLTEYTITLDLASMSAGALGKIALLSSFDQSNTDPSGALQNASVAGKDHATSGYHPYIEVTYTAGATPPTVDTLSATSVISTGATLNGEITDVGSEDDDERGFVWGTTTLGDPGNVAPADTDYDANFDDTGTFTAETFAHSISSLTPETTYYYRAFAHNAGGYVYGDEVSFDTSATPTFRFTNLPGIVFDEDDTTTIFAERLNDILDRLDALE